MLLSVQVLALVTAQLLVLAQTRMSLLVYAANDFEDAGHGHSFALRPTLATLRPAA